MRAVRINRVNCFVRSDERFSFWPVREEREQDDVAQQEHETQQLIEEEGIALKLRGVDTA